MLSTDAGKKKGILTSLEEQNQNAKWIFRISLVIREKKELYIKHVLIVIEYSGKVLSLIQIKLSSALSIMNIQGHPILNRCSQMLSPLDMVHLERYDLVFYCCINVIKSTI